MKSKDLKNDDNAEEILTRFKNYGQAMTISESIKTLEEILEIYGDCKMKICASLRNGEIGDLKGIYYDHKTNVAFVSEINLYQFL